MSERIYALKHKSGQYFMSQNLYLGIAELTNDIDSAKKMNLQSAEAAYRCMNEQLDWVIFMVDGFFIEEGCCAPLPKKPTQHTKAKDSSGTADVEKDSYCKCCGWPVIFACVNDEFIDFAEKQDPSNAWGWWLYCSNKGCIKHVGEGKFQADLSWVG